MSAAAVTTRRGRPPAAREAAAGARVVPLRLARAVMYLLLAGFGAVHWMAMLEPTATGRAFAAVAAGALAMLGLLAAGRLAGRAATAAAVGVGAVALALAFLGGGVADELLRPDGWGALASGIGRGLDGLPGARVPYRGVDEWTRIVIPLGGTALCVFAALLAFWPRRGGLGFPGPALVLLVSLYAVPAVALDFGAEYLRGVVLTVLVIGFLRLEKLRRRETGAAAWLALAAAVCALALAPLLDRGEPWWDYETWALSTAASKSTAFSWDHRYGALDWPRDGREMLRVRARQQAYWKAQNLDEFNGISWEVDRFGAASRQRPTAQIPDVANDPRWSQRIRVSVRNLRTRTFIGAGVTFDIFDTRFSSFPAGGIWVSPAHTLQRGDAYSALVYTPSPTERQLRAAAPSDSFELSQYRELELPDTREPDSGEGIRRAVSFPNFGDPGEPVVYVQGARGNDDSGEDATQALQVAGLTEAYAFARDLRERSSGPYDYMRRVERYLAGPDFSYTETPPPAAQRLPGFLFEAKSGYCQQYSGAMAMLLRMGGVPARVATGFTSGSFDRKTREWVVRDLDAHSWVEMWVPQYGWVTRDPTPAAAPPRSRQNEVAPGEAARPGAPIFGGERATDPNSGGLAATEGGTPWWQYALGGLAVLALAALAVLLWRRRRGGGRPSAAAGPLLELERALRRARRPAAPGTTLSGLEAGFERTPAAAGYVRALREARYSGRPAEPTSAQRRGLRGELARGEGLAGRLRAWWAVPPRPVRRG